MSDHREVERALVRIARRWPTWLLVVLFVALAGVCAAYGRLDDWLRAIGTVAFTLVALVLVARVARTDAPE